ASIHVGRIRIFYQIRDKRKETGKRRARTFTEGFAPPDEHHNLDAQIKSGETRHSLKIPTVSDE
ncbi:hypothetical protein K8P93_27740, partial [Klebsiella pneumoniae]